MVADIIDVYRALDLLLAGGEWQLRTDLSGGGCRFDSRTSLLAVLLKSASKEDCRKKSLQRRKNSRKLSRQVAVKQLVFGYPDALGSREGL